jgi:hypothetical protein
MHVTITKNKKLIVFKQEIALNCDNETKHIRVLCRQNVGMCSFLMAQSLTGNLKVIFCLLLSNKSLINTSQRFCEHNNVIQKNPVLWPPYFT